MKLIREGSCISDRGGFAGFISERGKHKQLIWAAAAAVGGSQVISGVFVFNFEV